jgi:hypothetical protein
MKAEGAGFQIITNEAFELRFAQAILAAAAQAQPATVDAAARPTQGNVPLTDDEIADALEAEGVEWQWIGSPNRADRRMTCGSIDADKIIAGVRSLLSTAQARGTSRAVVVGWANRHDMSDSISDEAREEMIQQGLPGSLAAEKYSVPLIQRAV